MLYKAFRTSTNYIKPVARNFVDSFCSNFQWFACHNFALGVKGEQDEAIVNTYKECAKLLDYLIRNPTTHNFFKKVRQVKAGDVVAYLDEPRYPELNLESFHWGIVVKSAKRLKDMIVVSKAGGNGNIYKHNILEHQFDFSKIIFLDYSAKAYFQKHIGTWWR